MNGKTKKISKLVCLRINTRRQILADFFLSAVFCALSFALFTILFCAFAPLSSYAGAGESGLQFLRIVQSPKSVAMGETGVGFYGDLSSSLALNPASLSLMRYNEFSFIYNMWVEDISIQQISFSHPTQKSGAFAGSLSMLSVKPFAAYDNSGGPAGQVQSSDLALQIAYSKKLWGQWNDNRYGIFAGGGLKYAREKLDTVKADTLLYDTGILYMKKFHESRLGVGASFMNLGDGLKFDKDKDTSPAIYRLGANYQIMFYGDYLSFSADLKKNSDGKKIMPSYGAEFMLKKIVALRLGYAPIRDIGNGLRFGIGFNLKNLKIDYAIASYAKFDYAHRIGISYSFGKPIEITPHLKPAEEKARWKVKRAKTLIKDELYYQAILELNEALKIDPKTPHALELMKIIGDKVELGK
ncbi:MAG: PorV/PorQ family protein [Elusimicrobia bacterium]|nr:PorV/PorQ family protein [Elusimicrobiota bacterium]